MNQEGSQTTKERKPGFTVVVTPDRLELYIRIRKPSLRNVAAVFSYFAFMITLLAGFLQLKETFPSLLQALLQVISVLGGN